MSLHGFSYTICDFATHTKTEKKYEVSQTFRPNTELSISLTISSPKATQKKSRIGLLQRNQFVEGIQLT